MSVNHGIYVSEVTNPVTEIAESTTGIPFVIGTAPLGSGTTATAGTPVLCKSYAEAVAAVGYNDNWTTYTICEVIYSHFKLYNASPVILLPLASGATNDSVAAAVQSVDLCVTAFGIVPDVIIAPGYSNNASVAAAMIAKAASINGMFKAKAIIDVEADSIAAAKTAKNGLNLTSAAIAGYPRVKYDGKVYHMSTAIAGCIATTDAAADGIPYVSPSNKSIYADSICKADGTAFLYTIAEANSLNEGGIVTALNFMGNIVLWGNYTAGYPTATEAKDKWISISRMFGYVSNTLIQTFWANIDQPMSNRLVDSILDSANVWLNGLVGTGCLYGARAEMLESENSVDAIASGIVKLHIYITPPAPAQEIDFSVEYDATYVTEAFSGAEE